MPHYVMLMRAHSSGMQKLKADPAFLATAIASMERWEAKILGSYTLLGE